MLLSLVDFDAKNYLDKNILLSSKSNFDISFNNNFKIKNYNLSSQVSIDDVKINLKNTNLKNYITNFEDKIILKNGKLNFKIKNKNKIIISIYSKYIFNNKQKAQDISLNYSRVNSIEKYKLYIDLIENVLNFNEINFSKKKR